MTRAVSNHPGEAAVTDGQYLLSPQQVHFFETFGFLKIPGLFSTPTSTRSLAALKTFLATRTSPSGKRRKPCTETRRRVIIPGFIEQSPRLAPLQHDPRISRRCPEPRRP